jgi:hypothetical protein
MRNLILKILFVIFLVTSLILPCVPVQADKIDSEQMLRYGNKMILKGGYEATFQGYTSDGQEIWKTSLGVPTYLEDCQTRIDTRWYLQEDGTYKSGDNKFSSEVADEKIRLNDKNNEYIEWQPEIKLVGKDKGKDSKLNANNVKPVLLLVDPMNENYINNTLVWHYDNGVDRYLRLIEGQCQEYFVINNELTSDLIIDPKAQQSENFDAYEKAVAYDEFGTGIELSEDSNKVVTLKAEKAKKISDTEKVNGKDKKLTTEELKEKQKKQIDEGKTPEVQYPIVIDPNYSFVSTASDSLFDMTNSVYATARTSTYASTVSWGWNYCSVGQFYETYSGYRIYRSALYFDTTALESGITITAADLKLYGSLDVSTVDFNITMQTSAGTYPHDPPQSTDYNMANYTTTSVGVLSTAGFSTNGYNTLNFNAADLSMINKGGMTKLFLRSSRDIAGTVPTGLEYIHFYSYERGDGYWPLLEVTFTAASPDVEAVNASDIGVYDAQLNSHITDDGGEFTGTLEIQFGYGTTSQAATDFNLYDVAGTGWVSGYYEGDYPSLQVSGLLPNTTYYYRVQVKNTNAAPITVTSSNEISFTTSLDVDDLSVFNGYPSNTSIDLSWAKGDGNNKVAVYYKTTPYISPNATLLSNGDFESSAAPPAIDDWVEGPPGGFSSRSNVQVKKGSYSGLITFGGMVALDISQEITPAASYQGSQLVFSCWVYTNAASRARVYLSDRDGAMNVETSYSSYHTATAQWEQLTATKTIQGDATNIYAVCIVEAGAALDVYFDDAVVIRGTAYPAEGTRIYFDTGSNYEHTGLTAGTTYYYVAFGESSDIYSDNGKYIAVTTSGAEATTLPSGGSLPTPVLPGSFNQSTDATRLSRLEPFYSLINNFSDSWGMPANTMWAIIIMVVIASISMIVLIESRNFMASTVVATVLVLGCIIMQLLPAWMIAVMILMDVGAWASSRESG